MSSSLAMTTISLIKLKNLDSLNTQVIIREVTGIFLLRLWGR